MSQRNPNWPPGLNKRLLRSGLVTWPPEWSNDRNLCINCEHPPSAHRIVNGRDGINRVYCYACPPRRTILMGNEEQYMPSPFFIEGRFAPAACFEERPAVRKVDNFLSQSSSSTDLATFTFQAETPGGDESSSITYHGYLLHPDDYEHLAHGDDIDKSSNRYKQYLYSVQEGRCVGC